MTLENVSGRETRHATTRTAATPAGVAQPPTQGPVAGQPGTSQAVASAARSPASAPAAVPSTVLGAASRQCRRPALLPTHADAAPARAAAATPDCGMSARGSQGFATAAPACAMGSSGERKTDSQIQVCEDDAPSIPRVHKRRHEVQDHGAGNGRPGGPDWDWVMNRQACWVDRLVLDSVIGIWECWFARSVTARKDVLVLPCFPRLGRRCVDDGCYSCIAPPQ